MNQTFQSEVEFLRAHGLAPVVLGNDEGARLVTLAEYQGRVMTSTMAGDGGPGCGWINRALIASGERTPHINAYGGEDRFWLGPEGGTVFALLPARRAVRLRPLAGARRRGYRGLEARFRGRNRSGVLHGVLHPELERIREKNPHGAGGAAA
ncbi:MAG: hypothetical protein L6W00_12870 [Lentisphaeria bacterium]|nr:MAG: hypothetical protein L6W00_12870 [Lentisphaeria bacterium]